MKNVFLFSLFLVITVSLYSKNVIASDCLRNSFGSLRMTIRRGEKPTPPRNRVTTPVDPAVRCANQPSAERCEQLRKKALSSGCINTEELVSLVKFGAYPVCDYDDNPPTMSTWCPCGCFDSSVNVLTANNNGFSWKPAGQIVIDWKSTKLASLRTDSFLNDFSFNGNKISLVTTGVEKIDLFNIETENGKGLKLTGEHPVLLSNGIMVSAKNLKVGDNLVGIDGDKKAILAIDRSGAGSTVVNFAIEENDGDKSAHIIAAEGVLVGDLVWQGSLQEEEKALLVRQ
ncbi:MAG: hypothetical protein HQK53_18810 [Oligoflexia bacterium]|nr:hypothetical protein [Oligoflexia bacterium]